MKLNTKSALRSGIAEISCSWRNYKTRIIQNERANFISLTRKNHGSLVLFWRIVLLLSLFFVGGPRIISAATENDCLSKIDCESCVNTTISSSVQSITGREASVSCRWYEHVFNSTGGDDNGTKREILSSWCGPAECDTLSGICGSTQCNPIKSNGNVVPSSSDQAMGGTAEAIDEEGVESNSTFTESSLTETQMKVISILPIISGIISIIASSVIIFRVYQSQFNNPYKRLLFVMSIIDIMASVNFALQPFLLPKETSSYVWAIGNHHTCTLSAALLQLSLIGVLYYTSLSFYFLAIVQFGMKPHNFRKKIEPLVHLICLGFPFATMIYGVIVNAYGETQLGPFCYVAKDPICEAEDIPENTFCNGEFVGWLSGGWILVSVLLIIPTNNIIIYCKVRKTTLQSTNLTSFSSSMAESQLARIHTVAVQSFLYVGAFFVTYSPIMIGRIVETLGVTKEDEARFYPLLVVTAIVTPLNGLFNCIIYLRPLYQRYRSRHQQVSRYEAMKRVASRKRIEDPTESCGTTSRSSTI